MLSKCANPACFARFLYLSQGRIFNVEMGEVTFNKREMNARKIELFWLCERCSQTLKVVFENGAVVIRPLHLQLPAARVRGAEKRIA
jgi:hypothetical protein